MRKQRKPGGRINQTGRSKYDTYMKVWHKDLDSDAYRSLSTAARALLIAVWRRHNGRNNGQIHYSHREARNELRVGNGKVQAAFQELQEKGFLIIRQKGAFDCKIRHATEWKITTLDCDGQPAKRFFSSTNWKIRNR